MSLILDALRKSEHQRQRSTGPALAVVPEGRHPHRPPTWALVLVGLLALNVLVLSAFMLIGRSGERRAADTLPPTAAPVTAPARMAPAASNAQLTRAPRSEPVPLPARPPRNDVRPLATETATAAPARPQPRSETPASTPATAPATPPPAAPARSAEDARLPRFQDMVVRGELNVPHMHLDIHVFSGDAAQRFVFINMRRYNEGQATQEGPRVERITPDGVVMDYQGQRFFLPRD